MKRYFKSNIKILLFLMMLIIVSGPFFSVVISALSRYLNTGLGDWLSFYGSIAGIVISLVVIHVQLYLESEKELLTSRPELIATSDYQLIKSGCRVYFDDKHWFRLVKQHNQNHYVSANSFEKTYSEENKRDKVLSLENVNNQQIFNLYILFGDNQIGERISKLDAGKKIYVVSQNHLEKIHSNVSGQETTWNHVPRTITIYFTTIPGEICKYTYNLDDKGNGEVSKKEYGVDYPITISNNRICDYFISK